jgi:hypothetical protein
LEDFNVRYFDEINGVTVERSALPPAEMARRSIRSCLRRLGKTDQREDTRANNLAELKRQRLLLMRLGKS